MHWTEIYVMSFQLKTPRVHLFEVSCTQRNWCYVPFHAGFWISNGFMKLPSLPHLGHWPQTDGRKCTHLILALFLRGKLFARCRGQRLIMWDSNWCSFEKYFLRGAAFRRSKLQSITAPKFAMESFDKFLLRTESLKLFDNLRWWN